MALSKIELHVVTPDKEFYSAEVDMIIFRSSEGDVGVYYDHTPIVTTLTSGTALIKEDGQEKRAVFHNGFAEITEEAVTILTDAAEWDYEIDIERAMAARERAEKRIEKYQHEEAVEASAEGALIRALARIELAQQHQTKMN